MSPASGVACSPSATASKSRATEAIPRRNSVGAWRTLCRHSTKRFGGWRSCTRVPASAARAYLRMSSLMHAARGSGSAAATLAWSSAPGVTRCAAAGWSAQRKAQRQKVPSHHGTVDRGLGAQVGDDEAGRRVPLHQALDVLAAELELATLVVGVGHLGDHVIGGRDQRLEFG